MTIEPSRRRGYQLHPPASPEAEALLAERGLTRSDIDRALAELERTEGIEVRTIIGINDDGVFALVGQAGIQTCPTPAPNRSSRCSGSRSWSQLGRVPQGSTTNFLRDGTLPN